MPPEPDRSPIRRIALATGLFVVSISVAGSAFADERVGGATSSVVYQTDDRIEYFQIPSPTWKAVARESVVAITPSSTIDLGAPGLTFPPFAAGTNTLDQVIARLYGATLCAGERFATQPAAVECSGTLIDADLVLTAGHCAPTLAVCAENSFVFDYLYSAAGTLESIDASDIYRCAHVLAHSETAHPHLDYAIVQLDRPVVGRVPADVRAATTPLPMGTGLVVIGFGTGLPMKFDDGGSVQQPATTGIATFVADTDTFAGNSGSGVFDDSGTLVGILVSGAEDYVASNACTVANVLPSSQAAEESTYAFHAIAALCSGGFRSAVCPANPAPSCGDHFCSGGEDAGTCAEDCTAPHCGDGTCTASAGETMATCIYDCPDPPTTRKRHSRCSVSLAGVRDVAPADGALLMVAVAILIRAKPKAKSR